jgi:hypothetical protein
MKRNEYTNVIAVMYNKNAEVTHGDVWTGLPFDNSYGRQIVRLHAL